MDLNRVTLIGNVSSTPEGKTLTSGSVVTKLNVATHYGWKDKQGERQKKTDFHTVIAWNKLGERMQQYLKKGDRLYIEGRINNHSYEGTDGKTRHVTDIVADNMIMLGKAKRTVEDDTTVEPLPEDAF